MKENKDAYNIESLHNSLLSLLNSSIPVLTSLTILFISLFLPEEYQLLIDEIRRILILLVCYV